MLMFGFQAGERVERKGRVGLSERRRDRLESIFDRVLDALRLGKWLTCGWFGVIGLNCGSWFNSIKWNKKLVIVR
jgi:hypothetical protein